MRPARSSGGAIGYARAVTSRAFRRLCLAVAGALVAGCVPSLGRCVLEAASGRVVDRDTGEPIAGAEVVEWIRGAGRMGGPQPELHARFATSDAEGRFAFERAFAPGPRLWFSKNYGPSYSFYHPSYGLIHGGEPGSAAQIVLRGSLRDSAARLADLPPYCRGEHPGAGARHLAAVACPPEAHASWPDGTPRASGELDPQGRRTGIWTFHYERGAPAARGEYRSGAPTGVWEFFDRRGRRAGAAP
jgi:hypothetical protein